MIDLYVKLIQENKKTLADVPSSLRKKVEEHLKEI